MTLRLVLAAASLAAIGFTGAANSATAAATAVEKVTVHAVAHFDFDADRLDPSDRDRLLAEVAQLKDVSWQTVTATGHTDSIGDAAYNADLSRRRAAAVRAYLLDKGLPPTLVRTSAEGDANPVAGNDTPEGRARNRRTEVVFEGVRTAPR